MPSTTPPSTTPGAGGAGRTASVVAGALVALLALAALAASATLFWIDGKKDDDGFLSTSTERLTSRTHAIASDSLDVDLGGRGSVLDSGDLGTVRLRAASRDGKAVFVGVARTADVDAYLHGVAHEEVADVDVDPFRVASTPYPGTAPAATPASRAFWAASAHGRGAQTVDWDVRDGSWSVVVMNADGSRGVDARMRVGADLPFLAPLAAGLAGGGLVLVVVAGALIFIGVRVPRSARPAAPGSGLAPA